MSEWEHLPRAHPLTHFRQHGRSISERFRRVILNFRRPEVEKWRNSEKGIVWDFPSIFFSVISGLNTHVYECKLHVAYEKPSTPYAAYFITRNQLGEKDELCVCVCVHACKREIEREMEKVSHDSITLLFLKINCSSSKVLIGMSSKSLWQKNHPGNWSREVTVRLPSAKANCIHTIFNKQTLFFALPKHSYCYLYMTFPWFCWINYNLYLYKLYKRLYK